jgi:hypothetical protein
MACCVARGGRGTSTVLRISMLMLFWAAENSLNCVHYAVCGI